MKSLRWRMAVWFALSVLLVMLVFASVTYFHLRHELRYERWERKHPEHSDWTLHGSYSEGEVEDIAGELWRLSLFYALPVALAALGIGFFLARRSLAPVADLNRQLADISARNLKQRVKLPRADREFVAIEANINGLLARLETSFAQLTEYSANVAHELRTPLTLMRLKVEDASSEIRPEVAEALQEELARLSEYVDQCLLLATAEQGRLEIKPDEVQMRALVGEMLEDYQLWAAQSERTITLVADEDFAVVSDRRYLKQVFHNLLTNAVKYGTGPIRITLMKSAQGAVCQIENAVNATTAAKQGNGLGLRIVRALAQSLGCKVETRHVGYQFESELRWERSAEAAARG
jgi:signal transduction histidine kinase